MTDEELEELFLLIYSDDPWEDFPSVDDYEGWVRDDETADLYDQLSYMADHDSE